MADTPLGPLNLNRQQIAQAVGPNHQIIRAFEQMVEMVGVLTPEQIAILFSLIRGLPPGTDSSGGGESGEPGIPGPPGAMGVQGIPGIPGAQGDDGDSGIILTAPALFYEQGVWIPSVGGTATYNTQSGKYTKIGNVVFFRGELGITLIGTGSTSAISGLSYPASEAGLVTVAFSTLALSVVSMGGYVFGNPALLTLTGLTVAAATITDPLAALGNGSFVIVSGFYLV